MFSSHSKHLYTTIFIQTILKCFVQLPFHLSTTEKTVAKVRTLLCIQPHTALHSALMVWNSKITAAFSRVYTSLNLGITNLNLAISHLHCSLISALVSLCIVPHFSPLILTPYFPLKFHNCLALTTLATPSAHLYAFVFSYLNASAGSQGVLPICHKPR